MGSPEEEEEEEEEEAGGEVDEIGISVPDEYRSHDSSSGEEGSESKESSEEEEGARPMKGGRTWYSIPDQKQATKDISAEDAVGG